MSTSTPRVQRSVVRRLRDCALETIFTAGMVWLLTGVTLRLTGTRDRFDGLSVVYYTTPWAVVAAGMAVMCLRTWRMRERRATAVFALMAIGAGIAWFSTSWYFGSPLAAKPDFRVVFWNTRNNEEDLGPMSERIRAFSPDVIALAEAGNHVSNIEGWQAAFPEYTVKRLPQQMLTMTKAGLQREESGDLAPGSFFGTHSSEINGRAITIIQADLDARPFRSRRKAIEALIGHVSEHAGHPLILLGDFNTPRQSWHLDPLRAMLTHAFETRGSGLADTWPIPLPVLSLDQVWVSPELEVVSCRQGWSLMSDHRPVFLEVRFK